MALRQIRFEGDPVLEKNCREVKEMTPRLVELVGDMLETMHAEQGVGLAAPQVGILRRIAVVDIGEGGPGPIVLVNPVILSSEGEVTDNEGCLSVPGKAGKVTRPQKICVRAFNEKMEPFEMEAEDFLARAICHEMDHLDGVLYVTKVTGGLFDVGEDEDDEYDEDEDAAEAADAGETAGEETDGQ